MGEFIASVRMLGAQRGMPYRSSELSRSANGTKWQLSQIPDWPFVTPEWSVWKTPVRIPTPISLAIVFSLRPFFGNRPFVFNSLQTCAAMHLAVLLASFWYVG